MSEKWDRMTRKAWEDSEVMQEFEKGVLKSIGQLQRLADLKQLKEDSQGAESGLAGVKREAVGVADAIESINADEDNPEELENEVTDEETEEITDEEHKEAKASLVEELTSMSYDAADSGNIKLAYRIERTISEILEEC
jgi:hypothetical protein